MRSHAVSYAVRAKAAACDLQKPNSAKPATLLKICSRHRLVEVVLDAAADEAVAELLHLHP